MDPNTQHDAINETPIPDWIVAARARGWHETLLTVLDLLEPLGPLAAQVMWVMQPAASIFGGSPIAAQLAQALEDPAALAELRDQLKTGS